MADFFTRLAEQTLGRARMVQPLVAPRFGPGRPLVGEAFSDSSEEPEADGDGERSHAFSERGTLTDSSSASPMPTLVSKEVSSSVTPAWPRTGTPDRVVPDTEPSPDHLVESRSEKEDQGPVSSVSQEPASATRPKERARTTLDGTSVRRRRAGSDRREPAEAVPSERTIRSKKLETFAPITRVVRSKDSPARERSEGRFPSLLKSTMAETHRQSSLREAREEIAFPEPSFPSSTIRVTIGRVEVRAIMPPSPPTRTKPTRPGPTLSLEDYLKQRNKGQK